MAPDGATACALNWLSGTVTPVNTSTGKAGALHDVGAYTYPVAAAVTD